MAEKILIVSNNNTDFDLIKKTINSKIFEIITCDSFCNIEELIFSGDFAAILADYDFVEERVLGWMEILQAKKSRSCLIFYGEKAHTENIVEILRKGAYGFIPRPLLAERIYGTLIDGLENRKAFVEILAMIDEQKNINERLEQEKIALRKKNKELDFINRLSCEVAYDLNWGHILPKMIAAGFLDIIDSDVVSVLYRIGNEWNFSCYLPGRLTDNRAIEKVKDDICEKFYSKSGEKIFTKAVSTSVYSSEEKELEKNLILSSDQLILPLIYRGQPLGALIILTKNAESFKNKYDEILSTILNILVISLNNVQKYQKVKSMTIKKMV